MSNIAWQIQSEIARLREQEIRASTELRAEAEFRRTWRAARRHARNAQRAARAAARREPPAEAEAPNAQASTKATIPGSTTAPETS